MIPIDARRIVEVYAGDPRYPEPGHVLVDDTVIYVRDDMMDAFMRALRAINDQRIADTPSRIAGNASPHNE